MEPEAPQNGRPGPDPRDDWQDRFLELFAQNGNIRLSAWQSGVGRETVRRERIRNEAFEQRFQDAKMDAVEIVEAELRRRATTGTPTTKTIRKIGRGGEILEETVMESMYISTAAAIAFLKANHPAYRERMEVTGAEGGPIAFQVERERTPSRLEELLNIAAELGWSPAQRELGSGGNGSSHNGG